MADVYENLGDLSAVDPPYQRAMRCDACRVRWQGCADAFECPRCGAGELPTAEIMEPTRSKEAA